MLQEAARDGAVGPDDQGVDVGHGGEQGLLVEGCGHPDDAFLPEQGDGVLVDGLEEENDGFHVLGGPRIPVTAAPGEDYSKIGVK